LPEYRPGNCPLCGSQPPRSGRSSCRLNQEPSSSSRSFNIRFSNEIPALRPSVYCVVREGLKKSYQVRKSCQIVTFLAVKLFFKEDCETQFNLLCQPFNISNSYQFNRNREPHLQRQRRRRDSSCATACPHEYSLIRPPIPRIRANTAGTAFDGTATWAATAGSSMGRSFR